MAHSMALGSTASSIAVSAASAGGNKPVGLTQEQRSLLASIVSVLTPGAGVSCACIDSLERRLDGPLARMLPAIQQGLAAMDAACIQKTGSGILELRAPERSKFVRELRSGHKLTAFFQLITSSCSISS